MDNVHVKRICMDLVGYVIVRVDNVHVCILHIRSSMSV
jgi:hypothetical protein